MIAMRDNLRNSVNVDDLHDAATFTVNTRASMLEKAVSVGVLATENEDVRSLREMIIYGLKGMAAYAEHAKNIGKEELTINAFIYEALAATLDDSLTADDLVALTLKTGEYGVKVMALLDEAHTSRFGNPEITEVNIGVRKNPAILISGHDLTDLEQLLEQTKGTGVDVYTHSEMLPAHYYPAFKKYDNFAGNYGNAWWKQLDEFVSFHGPVLFTTNCIARPEAKRSDVESLPQEPPVIPAASILTPTGTAKRIFQKSLRLPKLCPHPMRLKLAPLLVVLLIIRL
jgi:hydroxylamine reductase